MNGRGSAPTKRLLTKSGSGLDLATGLGLPTSGLVFSVIMIEVVK